MCLYLRTRQTELSNNAAYWCSLHRRPWRGWCVCAWVCVCIPYLVAVHHEVVGGNEGFEDHHPAWVGCSLEKSVCQLGNVDVHLIGAVDQICSTNTHKQNKFVKSRVKHSHNTNLQEKQKIKWNINFRKTAKWGGKNQKTSWLSVLWRSVRRSSGVSHLQTGERKFNFGVQKCQSIKTGSPRHQSQTESYKILQCSNTDKYFCVTCCRLSVIFRLGLLWCFSTIKTT